MLERIENSGKIGAFVVPLIERILPEKKSEEIILPSPDLPVTDFKGNPVQWESVYNDLPESAAMLIEDLTVSYAKKGKRKLAVHGVTIPISKGEITAFIGSSACGKSTVLRSLNRMNDPDIILGAQVQGSVTYYDQDREWNVEELNPYALRAVVGMVSQKPDPFPQSIYDNVAYGPRRQGITNRKKLDEIVYGSLEKAALLDELEGDVSSSGLDLSGGQQQRLSIARALAMSPQILLMDEPCSALDPGTTLEIERLMRDLVAKHNLTIVIVTHDMDEAGRVADYAAYFGIRKQKLPSGRTLQWGTLVEYGKSNRADDKDLDDEPRKRLFNGKPQLKETKAFMKGKL